MEVIIRKANTSNLKAVQDLNYALFQSDADKDNLLNMNWPYQDGEDYFRRMISGEIGVCFVAEAKSQIIGYLAGSIKTDMPSYRPIKRAELENMLVAEDYRGKGVGEKLVKEFISWSKVRGASRAFVSAYWLNKKAAKFYERLGFEPYAIELETKLI